MYIFKKMQQDIIAIICPDIHGRDFWKNAANNYDGSIPFIFLGDYLDVYSYEGISNTQVKENFQDIWDFKQKWGDNVHLLLGNHDLSYYDKMFHCCRYSLDNAQWYTPFLKEHWEHFSICYEMENNDTTILFSHAGVLKKWLDDNHFEEIYNADYINSLFTSNPKAFTDYNYYRGGEYWVNGSPVWADIREFFDSNYFPDKLIQIVGHTSLMKDKLQIGNVFCIDSQQPFVLTKNNDVEKYNKE